MKENVNLDWNQLDKELDLLDSEVKTIHGKIDSIRAIRNSAKTI